MELLPTLGSFGSFGSWLELPGTKPWHPRIHFWLGLGTLSDCDAFQQCFLESRCYDIVLKTSDSFNADHSFVILTVNVKVVLVIAVAPCILVFIKERLWLGISDRLNA